MKLVAATAAAMAVAASADHGESQMVPMEGDMDMEAPWYEFLYDYGLEMDEEKWTFDTKDPKIHIESFHDGSKFQVKSPWYNERYEQKMKDTAYEMKFKNEIPGMEVKNKIEYKQAQFNKNTKVEDPDCTNENKKKCLIKTQVGLQNKREFRGEHSNEGGKYKVWQYQNYVHDMDMKPTEIHHREGWDFANHVHPESDTALGMTMDDGDMAMNPWYTKGESRFDVNMAYKRYTDNASGESMDHWDSTVWSFSHTTDNVGEGENVMAAEGSSSVQNLEWSLEEQTAQMSVKYDASCNQGWSDHGLNTQRWENVDMCQEMMMTLFEGRYEDFMMGELENPCTWLSEVEGTFTSAEQEATDYSMGIALQMTSMKEFSILYKNSMTDANNWAKLFSIKSVDNADGQEETTVSCMGEDSVTFNWEKLMAHHMEMSDKMARMMFEMYKHWEFERAEWAQIDWTNEDHLRGYFSTIINWDYPMQKMADMERAAIQEWQQMECNYPHWEEMSANGLTFHDKAKEQMYQCKSQMIQHMQLAEEVDFMRLNKLAFFFYTPDGSMTTKEIMMTLWSMEHADAYDWVADQMEAGTLDLYVDNVMFMYKYLEMEMPTTMTLSEEEEAAIREQFEQALPSNEQLRAYANKIRNFEVQEMSWADVDAACNEMCNAHFEGFLAGHKEMADMHISYVVQHREMTQEWVGKYNDWINTPREQVEAIFDDYMNRFEEMKESVVYECEYQFWAAPGNEMRLYTDLSEECQNAMAEKYEGIREWGDASKMDGLLENEESET